MRQGIGQCGCGGHRAVTPFLGLGVAAILAGGLVAAAVAHEPSRDVVWMVAYLVLIVGLAQVAFGVGQLFLADIPVSGVLVAAQFLLFNAGNAGVIGGTLTDVFAPVAVGTLLVLLALALFLYGSRGDGRRRLRRAYVALLALIALGALVGVTLSALNNVA